MSLLIWHFVPPDMINLGSYLPTVCKCFVPISSVICCLPGFLETPHSRDEDVWCTGSDQGNWWLPSGYLKGEYKRNSYHIWLMDQAGLAPFLWHIMKWRTKRSKHVILIQIWKRKHDVPYTIGTVNDHIALLWSVLDLTFSNHSNSFESTKDHLRSVSVSHQGLC